MGSQRVKLAQYLSEVHRRCFVLGDFDCLIFTNNCWNVLYDQPWSPDWLGAYHTNGILHSRKELRKTFGFNTVLEGIDSKLNRGPKIPPFGSLVGVKSHAIFVGYALGISLGDQAVFVKERGLEYLPVSEVEHTWVHNVKQ